MVTEISKINAVEEAEKSERKKDSFNKNQGI